MSSPIGPFVGRSGDEVLCCICLEWTLLRDLVPSKDGKHWDVCIGCNDRGMATFKAGGFIRPIDIEIAETPWVPGDIVEYNDYGSKFRARLVRKDPDGSKCWSAVLTEVHAVGDSLQIPISIGNHVSVVEGHSVKVAHVTDGSPVCPAHSNCLAYAGRVRCDGSTAKFAYGDRVRPVGTRGCAEEGTITTMHLKQHSYMVEWESGGKGFVYEDELEAVEAVTSHPRQDVYRGVRLPWRVRYGPSSEVHAFCSGVDAALEGKRGAA